MLKVEKRHYAKSVTLYIYCQTSKYGYKNTHIHQLKGGGVFAHYLSPKPQSGHHILELTQKQMQINLTLQIFIFFTFPPQLNLYSPVILYDLHEEAFESFCMELSNNVIDFKNKNKTIGFLNYVFSQLANYFYEISVDMYLPTVIQKSMSSSNPCYQKQLFFKEFVFFLLEFCMSSHHP